MVEAGKEEVAVQEVEVVLVNEEEEGNKEVGRKKGARKDEPEIEGLQHDKENKEWKLLYIDTHHSGAQGQPLSHLCPMVCCLG